MEYQALYRRYRPQTFAEVVGQEHVTHTLAREIQSESVAHAYLFAGPRGTGKTSTARIIAKALNCTDLAESGEPCNRCDSCIGVTEGTSLDVIELDAASHNKVEDVREIRANVGTVAAGGAGKRVYILDEAHMLSRAAANALLKTLEEPPDHAFFVLATTEPYKLPDTIRSRTQRFDFHPIGSELLAHHLAAIATRENIAGDAAGLAMIARHARGSVRDGLGILEQVAALGSGVVDQGGVTRALGLVPADLLTRLATAVSAQDAPAALVLVSEVAAAGADLRRFVTDGIEFFRGLFLAQYAPNLEEIVDEPMDVIDSWREQSRRLSPGEVLRAIDELGNALMELREGREERLVVELALLKLTRPETSSDPAALAARIDRLEDRVKRLGSPAAGESIGPPQSRAIPEPTAGVDAPSAPATPPVEEVGHAEEEKKKEGEAVSDDSVVALAEETPITLDAVLEETPATASNVVELPVAASSGAFGMAEVDAIWPALVARIREDAGARRHALFRDVRPADVDGSTLVLGVPADLPFHLAQLQGDPVLETVVPQIATDLLGEKVAVVYRAEEVSAGPQDALPLTVKDAGDLVESDEGAIDAAELVVDILGGEIVDDD